jgi:hypothetical protein
MTSDVKGATMPVYFLQAADGGPVKIGFTANLKYRKRDLEKHYGKPLSLLATRDGGKENEAAIHAMFDHLRLGRTEQFRPDADLMAFIESDAEVNSNTNAPEIMRPVRPAPKVQQNSMRLGDDALAALDWIAGHYGLPSRSCANRYAIARFAEQHPGFREDSQEER